MWTIKSNERLELHDEEEDEVIAILLWDERFLNWKLYYRYTGGSGYAYLDSMEGFGKLDIEALKGIWQILTLQRGILHQTIT